MEILKLIYFALQSFSQAVVSFIYDPDFIINPILILIILIIVSQYKRVIAIQKQMYGGRARSRLWDMVSASMLAGILAGLAGSVIITVLGITFLKLNGLIIVILLSMLLMFFVNPRYVCLSYSGGILSILSLILTTLVAHGFLDKNTQAVKFIQNQLDFDVSGLMLVVGIMHLIEAALIKIDGHRDAVPVFMKHKGRLVGGFVMQRLWVIPILFFVMAGTSDISGQTVATPHWWPLFGPNLTKEQLRNSLFAATPLLAMLGYSDFSISTPIKKKAKRTSMGLFSYSVILLILAMVSYKIHCFKYIAALFAPIAHEALILFERYKESTGSPIWSYSEDGVIVVDTIPQSTAERIGIKSGDKLVGINNMPVKSPEDIINILSDYLNYIWIDIINMNGEKRLIEFANYQGRINELGIITVPKDDKNVIFVEERNNNLFKDMMNKFRG